jgi:hypothetical protein
MMPAESIARALGGRRAGKGWLARRVVHDDRDPSLYIEEGPDGLPRFRCFAGCEWREVRTELAHRGLLHTSPGLRLDPVELTRKALARKAKIRAVRETGEAEALAVWRTGRLIEPGDLAGRYFIGRGLTRPTLGWPPSLQLGRHRSSSGRVWPALIAGACRWPGHKPVAVQVTPLREPGVKAWRKPQRLSIGWPGEAAVRLAGWVPGRRIVLVEGVEDGLAVLGACPDVVPWAVLGAGNAGSVRLPDGAEVTLCLDGDEAGRRAALAAGKELWRRGHRVSVGQIPDGLDPLDLLRRQES